MHKDPRTNAGVLSLARELFLYQDDLDVGWTGEAVQIRHDVGPVPRTEREHIGRKLCEAKVLGYVSGEAAHEVAPFGHELDAVRAKVLKRLVVQNSAGHYVPRMEGDVKRSCLNSAVVILYKVDL